MCIGLFLHTQFCSLMYLTTRAFTNTLTQTHTNIVTLKHTQTFAHRYIQPYRNAYQRTNTTHNNSRHRHFRRVLPLHFPLKIYFFVF